LKNDAKAKARNKPEETDFSEKAVPNVELVACRLWEYSRESATVRGLVEKLCVPYTTALSELGEIQAYIMPLFCGICGLKNLPLSTPWQELPPDSRRRVVEFLPLPVTPKGQKKANRPDGFSDAGFNEFYNLANQDRRAWDFSHEDTCTKFDAISKAFKPASIKYATDGWPHFPPRYLETRAFTIDWSRRNEQIAAAFNLWLQKNRPAEWLNDAKGEKVTSLRVDLERLGTMRKIKSDPSQADSERNKDARRALQCFRELFPSLTEFPLSWPWETAPAELPSRA
jgi:hypothetical protein